MATTHKYFPKVHDWVKAKKKKPFAFDLVIMKHKDGFIKVGWWNGNDWDSLKNRDSEVIEWKRRDERYGEDEY